MDEERILQAAWMLPNTGTLTNAQRKQAMGNFGSYLRRHEMTFTDVARQIGKPKATTIGDLTKGVYRANADEHIRKLNMFIEQHARARAASLTEEFVTTKVAKDMMTAARLVRENGTCGLVLGPTGIGKSRCAMAIHEKYVGSIYICVMRGYHHPKGLTAKLAIELGLPTRYSCQMGGVYMTQLERVVSTLRDSNRLIMIDEASKLTHEGIELCREIHDATGAPFLLIATKDLHDRITRDTDPDHGQLYSRFDVIHHLTEGFDMYQPQGKPLFTVADIKALYDVFPVRLSQDATHYLQGLANVLGYGSLRRCRMLVQNAIRRARNRRGVTDDEKVTITAADLEWVETRLRRESSEQQTVIDRRKRAANTGVS